MTDPKIAPQVEFKSLEDFVRDSNNFFLFFLPDCWASQSSYRTKEAFLRFQKAHPEIDREISQATITAVRDDPTKSFPPKATPWEKLFDAYKTMSQLVFADDRYVMRDGKLDDWFLCR